MNSESIILWGIGTPRTLRAHWTLWELGLPYECRPVQSRSGETTTEAFTRLNRGGKIPVLQIGDNVLTESAAIAIYLAERYGSGRLIPAVDNQDRGQFLRWCFFAMMELDAHTLYVLRKHVALVDVYGEAPAAVRTAQDGYQRQIQVVADAFSDNRSYILGDQFTVADILLVTCILDDPAGIGVVMDIPGNVLDYARRLKQRKAFTQALEVNKG